MSVKSTVQVEVPGGSYPIHIAPGMMLQLGATIPADASAILLLSNSTVRGLYGDVALRALESTGKVVHCVDIEDGEAFKTLDTLNRVYTFMLEHRLDRKAVLVALGGGVVGDLGGFAAATFMRGIRFVQVPTTLLAQVDSSVGGKTAVNHPLGKNLIGAFYQPIAVSIDTQVLHSLPAREVAAGLAEVIKYGLIMDKAFFEWCECHAEALKALDPEAITYAIQRSCELKAEVVGKDEKEAGLRMILNFGHTFGHVIENGLGYGQWLHGEAVGCGMVLAAELSQRCGYLSEDEVGRIRDVVCAIGCPVQAPDLGGVDRWLEIMMLDKKATSGQLKFIVLGAIGQALVQESPMDRVREVISQAIAASPAMPTASTTAQSEAPTAPAATASTLPAMRPTASQ